MQSQCTYYLNGVQPSTNLIKSNQFELNVGDYVKFLDKEKTTYVDEYCYCVKEITQLCYILEKKYKITDEELQNVTFTHYTPPNPEDDDLKNCFG